ncbi:hypothetical protein AVEN_100160-1 [Araneus ventricosus]|uniref:Uncharacterized protein n=1 Tax=Araneus ventricosus TaxID=182803 RepID=A0A4Y2QWJ0_ARAVE|nr:hypothetical protein AVEN_100160-1 [Araneus ventricosus]
MRSTKQTERQQLLMESSLAYPRGKKENNKKTQVETKTEGDKTLGYLGVVNTVTSKEDVPLRGIRARIIRFEDYRAHSGHRKKLKEKHFQAYHACKIDVDVRSRDSFRETSEP